MKERKQHEPGKIHGHMNRLNPLIIYLIVALVALGAGNGMIYCGWYIAAIIFYLIYSILVVKMVSILYDMENADYKKYRAHSSSLNELEKRIGKIEDKLAPKVDISTAGTERRGSIRPGSRPSIEYLDMIVQKEDKHD